MLNENFDHCDFWKESDYATKNYTGKPINERMIDEVEKLLGYKLPGSYLELLKIQNGGIPQNTNFPTKEATSWAEDHVAISGIFGLDSNKIYSILGELGSEFMKDEWEYPDIGIYICDCPSAGHDMIALDYTKCGNTGEPRVVHVDQESDFKVTFLADNFQQFITNLVPDSTYDEDDTW